MNIDNYFDTGEIFPLSFVCFSILDRMNSVGTSELNIIFNVFIFVWSREENDPIQKMFLF